MNDLITLYWSLAFVMFCYQMLTTIKLNKIQQELVTIKRLLKQQEKPLSWLK
jgi:hypothetical protein